MRTWTRAAAALGAAAALATVYMLAEAQAVRRVVRRLPAPGVHPDLDGLVVVHLSDFHAGFQPSLNLRAMRKAVDLTLAAGPDLIVITGDLAPGPRPAAGFRRQLARLRAPLGVFAVLGNHDHGDSKAPFVRPTDPADLEACGVRVLVNDAATVARGAGLVQICGVDDGSGHDDLPAVLARLDRRPGVLRLLLTHHADVAMGATPGDFAMAFAGDTHGGQICLPLPGRRIMLSDLGARFAEGEYEVDGRRLYVTRGVGASLLPFRAFCRPEVVVFTVSVAPSGGSVPPAGAVPQAQPFCSV
ncbi:MAG TPA: metallophosphoesterase [Thermoleophilia bacterium]|mgnify:CR=1 FL=1|nr:metallophosphoesterase [Thermoleophilia bacterium]